MKKDLIFSSALAAVGIALFLFRLTGMVAHIIISVVGILLLAGYTVLTKKEWKIPGLEILMRAFYGIALITGIIVMNVAGVLALSIIHKVSAALFVLSLLALLAHKLIVNYKKA